MRRRVETYSDPCSVPKRRSPTLDPAITTLEWPSVAKSVMPSPHPVQPLHYFIQ